MRSLERSPDSASPFFLFQKVQKTVEAQVQHIYRIVDMTVCYNNKTAIQTVWNSGRTSNSVVIDWWTSLCDAKTGACVQWIALTKFPGFAGLCRSFGSASDKNHAEGSSNSCAGVSVGQTNPRWELIKWLISADFAQNLHAENSSNGCAGVGPCLENPGRVQ